MNIRILALSIIFMSWMFISIAQSTPDMSKLVPKQCVNLKKSATSMMTAMVNVTILGDIQESQACQIQSLAYGGLKLEINWYNTNDETGKMMLGMVSNKPDIEKHWAGHKKQIEEIHDHYTAPGNSYSCSDVIEEDLPGGKLYFIYYSYNLCETEKAKQTMVNARCFFFNGTATGNIEINCQCKPDEVREMVKNIINNSSDFAFSGLAK